jgi:5-methylcytosine-specific restriction endonuclease McrA
MLEVSSNKDSQRWFKEFKSMSNRYICKNCGNEYIAKSKERNTYCSRACSFAYKTAHKKIKEIKEIVCACCSKKIKRGIYCSSCRIINSRECAKNAYIKKSSRTGKKAKCKECGVEFAYIYGNKHRVYCSDICSRKQSRRIGKAVRRAKERNSPYESIDPLIVLRQDNYVCYLCGEITNPSLRGTIDLKAPEVDHVIPLSAGGHHVRSNVRCVCRKCNLDKSNKLIITM